jgi:hypothetical protein
MLIACRFNLPRNDDDAIAAALEAKTGVLYAPVRLQRFSASAATGAPII